jgi:hypothetical protein
MQQNASQPPVVGSTGQVQITEQQKALIGQLLQKRTQSGANWFLWIAGLSLINTFAAAMGSNTRFIAGLGITQIADAVVAQAGKSGNPVALAFDFLAAGIFIAFGLWSRKRREWAFIVGMILYALDGLLFLLAKDVLSIGFHLFALYMIYKGLKAAEALRKLSPAGAAGPGGFSPPAL